MIDAFEKRRGLHHYVSDFVDDAKMLSHCAPIFIMPSSAPFFKNVQNNGTAALIDTGSRKLLVTCEHVLSEFLNFRAGNSEAVLVAVFRNGCGLQILLDSLIDHDEKLDLAVFDASFPKQTLDYKGFYRIHRFPVADPRPRQPISFVGFPGEARRSPTPGILGNFGYASFGLTVSDVSDSLIILANTDPRILRDGAGNVVPPINVGGMSGAPAYTRTSSGGFNLVGFVRAGNNSNTDIRLSKASFLREDGSLFRPAWHPCPTLQD